MKFLVKLVFLPIVVFAVLIGAIRVVAVATIPQGGAACLRIISGVNSNRLDSLVVDGRTGAYMRMSIHSDQQRSVILVPPMSGQPILWRASYMNTSSLMWSPDNRQFAYFLNGGPGDYHINLFDIASQTTQTLLNEKILSLPVWSPDGQYIALYVGSKDAPQIKLWSVGEKRVIKTIQGRIVPVLEEGLYTGELTWFGNQTHFIYLDSDSKNYYLSALNNPSEPDVALPIPSDAFSDFQWSSNKRFMSILMGARSLYILTSDGKLAKSFDADVFVEPMWVGNAIIFSGASGLNMYDLDSEKVTTIYNNFVHNVPTVERSTFDVNQNGSHYGTEMDFDVNQNWFGYISGTYGDQHISIYDLDNPYRTEQYSIGVKYALYLRWVGNYLVLHGWLGDNVLIVADGQQRYATELAYVWVRPGDEDQRMLTNLTPGLVEGADDVDDNDKHVVIHRVVLTKDSTFSNHVNDGFWLLNLETAELKYLRPAARRSYMAWSSDKSMFAISDGNYVAVYDPDGNELWHNDTIMSGYATMNWVPCH